MGNGLLKVPENEIILMVDWLKSYGTSINSREEVVKNLDKLMSFNDTMYFTSCNSRYQSQSYFDKGCPSKMQKCMR